MLKIGWTKRPYRWLLTTSLLFFVLYLFFFAIFETNQQVLNWTGRLSASIFGAYLTAVLVDGVFREKERQRQAQIKAMVSRELSHPLSKEKKLIEEFYKAAVLEPPNENKIENLKDLVESDVFKEIRMLDFYSTCPRANLPNSYDWVKEFKNTHDSTETVINGVLKKYGFILESELIESLEDLRDSEFINYIESYDIDLVREEQDKAAFLLSEYGYEKFKGYINNLEAACDNVDQSFENRNLKILFRDDIAPTWGVGRVTDRVTVDELVELNRER